MRPSDWENLFILLHAHITLPHVFFFASVYYYLLSVMGGKRNLNASVLYHCLFTILLGVILNSTFATILKTTCILHIITVTDIVYRKKTELYCSCSCLKVTVTASHVRNTCTFTKHISQSHPQHAHKFYLFGLIKNINLLISM